MGRPKKLIDPKHVEKLAQLGATHKEIADFFQCDRSTIESRFSAEIAKGKAALKFKLRRWQLRAAERGNAAVLIWLGKTLLAQHEGEQEDADNSVQLIIHTVEEPRPHSHNARADCAASSKPDGLFCAP